MGQAARGMGQGQGAGDFYGESKDNIMKEERQGFRKLNAWQNAYDLALDVYKITKTFPKSEVYGLSSAP